MGKLGYVGALVSFCKPICKKQAHNHLFCSTRSDKVLFLTGCAIFYTGHIMNYTALYNDFLLDKQNFFSPKNRLFTTSQHSSAHIRNVKRLTAEKDQVFLAKYRVLIEQEFEQTFASLRGKASESDEFWLYCYYCCLMLQAFYRAYDKPSELDKYSELGEQIRKRYETGHFEAGAEANTEEVFLDYIQKKMANDIGVMAITPKHISKLRDWLTFANIYRIQMAFCRISIKQYLLLMHEFQWLDKLNSIFGTNANIENMMATLNAPGDIFNLLSVGLFAARFILNAGTVLKHTLIPADGEKVLPWKERLSCSLSMNRRYCNMLNDAVWGTVNSLTNYAPYFHISAPVASWLTAGFLVFDVSLLVYRRHLENQDYLTKKAQYTKERDQYLALAPSQENTEHCKMLLEQITQLDMKWHATSAGFMCNILAATLLMSGFTATLLLASLPVAVTVGYFACAIAVALYLSADVYGAYVNKTEILQRQELKGLDTREAQFYAHKARNDFILSMVKNTVMPLLMVMTAAVCWQAALVIAVAYVGYHYAKRPDTSKPPAEEPHDPVLNGAIAAF